MNRLILLFRPCDSATRSLPYVLAAGVIFLASGCMGGNFSPQLSGSYTLSKPAARTVPHLPPQIDVSMRYSLQGGSLLPVIKWSWGGASRLAFSIDQILQCGLRTRSDGSFGEECWAAAIPLPSTIRHTGGLEPTCFAQSVVFASVRWNLQLKLLMDAYASESASGEFTPTFTLSPERLSSLQPNRAAIDEVRRALNRDHALKFQVRFERRETRRESRCTSVSGPDAEQLLSLPPDAREFEYANTHPWERQSEDLLTPAALREGDQYLFQASQLSTMIESVTLPWL